MATKVILEDEDVNFIHYLCDLALKQGGLAAMNPVGHLLSRMPIPKQASAPSPPVSEETTQEDDQTQEDPPAEEQNA